jgi:predicted GTPase
VTTNTGTDHRLSAQTVEVVDELVARSADLELPAPSEVLLQLRDKLAEDSYRVLVVGEAKRGKSTLINALLGADVLPTDIDIATSQVFYVRSGQRETYRLRFEDGSVQDIERADLERFGSQVVADRGDGARPTRDIRWIEVEVPARFVPERVAILDTPGLGALYAAHAQITRRFVPQADAVLLILDSAQPVGAREVELLEAILEVTQRVFFVQTKIDQHDREAWEQTRQRSEEIIRERFADQIPDIRVWPVSSSNLLSATRSDDAEALVFVSRYRQLAAALQAFLEDVCAAPRAAETLVLAAQHQRTSAQVLGSRLQSLTDQSGREAAAYKDTIEKRWRQFQADWGEQGQQRQALQQGIRRVTALSKQGFREALAPGGSVMRAQEARIEALQSLEEVNQLGETLGGEVAAAVTDEWTRVVTLAGQQYTAIFAPFIQATDAAIAGPEVATVETTTPKWQVQEAGGYDRLRGSFGYAVPILGIAGILGPATPLIFPVALPAALWFAVRGWKEFAASKTKAGKAELQRYLRNVLQQMQQHFFSVELSTGRFSRVDEYFNNAEASLSKQLDTVVTQRVADMRAELTRLQAQAKLSAKEREEAAQRLRAALDGWEQLGRRIAELLDDQRSRSHLEDLTRQAASAAATELESATSATAGTTTPGP